MWDFLFVLSIYNYKNYYRKFYLGFINVDSEL